MTDTITLQPALLPVPGQAEGDVLPSAVPLSFWGGVDPANGRVIGRHHPLCGEDLTGRALVIPHGRGSCTGSAVLLEAIHAGTAPALIVLSRCDDILALGAIVAAEAFGLHMPVVVLNDTDFALASGARHVALAADGYLHLQGCDATGDGRMAGGNDQQRRPESTWRLDARDRAMLGGESGPATQLAMRILCRMARLQGATRLIDVTRVHIDSCIHTGPAGLAFAERLADLGGRVAVPTTLNAISIDRRRWREQGVPEEAGVPADRLAHAFDKLGATATYTCAPYLLDDPPVPGEIIAWAESNAVVYANSVLGARTNKTPDLLDTCIALTGRVPDVGYYRDDGRKASVIVSLPDIADEPDDIQPLLGYLVGQRAQAAIPAIVGMPTETPSDDLKAFGAAFATTGSAGLFHIVGLTPEAGCLDDVLAPETLPERMAITPQDVAIARAELGAGGPVTVDLVALGNPHFSLDEFARLAILCRGRRRSERTELIVTTSRHVAEQAEQAGYLAVLEAFGARIVTDTCWCMIREPLIPPDARIIVTRSAKYAHYGPGLVDRRVHLAGLAACVQAAVSGHLPSVTAENRSLQS